MLKIDKKQANNILYPFFIHKVYIYRQKTERMKGVHATYTTKALGKTNTAFWASPSKILIELDQNISREAILNKLSIFAIEPTKIFTNERGMLIEFNLDKEIADKKLAKFISANLLSMLDASRVTKSKAKPTPLANFDLSYEGDAISTNSLIESLNVMQIHADSGRTRKVMETLKNDILPFNNGVQFKNFDLCKAIENVQILNDLVQGEKLTFNQIFGLATNLVWVRGGLKMLSDAIEKNKLYPESYKAIATYVAKAKPNPRALADFSHYEEDSIYNNIIESAHTTRGYITVQHTQQPITLADAENLMKESFDKAMQAVGNGIYIIKCATGLGKTRLLETARGATIALPTNDLKGEVSKRMKVPHAVTPELPNLIDSALRERLSSLYAKGLNNIASKVIKKISKEKHSDAQTLTEYLKSQGEAYKSARTVLTTHQRVVHSPFRHDTIIFDECPLQSILTTKTFHLADLGELVGGADLEKFGLNEQIKGLRKDLEESSVGRLLQTPIFDLCLSDLEKATVEADMRSDIISFLNSDYYIRDKHDPSKLKYISRNDLPADKKIIILSASVPSFIYENLYPSRTNIVEIDNVVMAGTVLQHTSRSFSRTSLRKMDIDKIVSIVDTALPTITFASEAHRIPNAEQEIYFGNVSGYDALKGKDINVVGTPHMNNSLYLLIASAIGIRFKMSETVMEYREITNRGLTFKFMSYTEGALQKIQLALIEAELIQAVGRARALRESCKVNLYSNFPICGAQYVK